MKSSDKLQGLFLFKERFSIKRTNRTKQILHYLRGRWHKCLKHFRCAGSQYVTELGSEEGFTIVEC